MHAPILTIFSLFFLPISFFLSILFNLSFLLLSCCGLFPLWFFLFLGPSLWVPPPLSASLRCYHSLTMGSSFSSIAASHFYSELIQWDFSLLPLSFINCFWFVLGIPSGLPTNPLVVQPLPLLSTFSLHHYSFHDKIPFCLFLLYTSTSRFKWIRIGLPHHLPLWHASDGPNHLLSLLGKIPSQ